MQNREQSPWPGMRSRVSAFAVDSLVLGLIGGFVGLIAFDQLAALGDKARLIGLLLTLTYFGLLCSRVGSGQTIGMRLLKIRIVGLDGKHLGLMQSLGRALVLSAPFILNGIMLRGNQSVPDQLSVIFARRAVPFDDTRRLLFAVVGIIALSTYVLYTFHTVEVLRRSWIYQRDVFCQSRSWSQSVRGPVDGTSACSRETVTLIGAKWDPALPVNRQQVQVARKWTRLFRSSRSWKMKEVTTSSITSRG